MPQAVALIVPCFNEAGRLDLGELLRLVRARQGLRLVMVDDGSADSTPARLAELQAAEPTRVTVLQLERNRGKAEAVRRGLIAGMAAGAQVVGYIDADLSTPVDEVLGLLQDMERHPVEVLLASRVRLLGTDIDRRPMRHVLGRVFATVASIALRLRVYDTQCGAKLFRAGAALQAALEVPFRSRWIFDVELLARLLEGGPAIAPVPVDAFRERPLQAWRDVGGSKLRPRMAFWAGLQLLGILVHSRIGGKRRAREDRGAHGARGDSGQAPTRSVRRGR